MHNNMKVIEYEIEVKQSQKLILKENDEILHIQLTDNRPLMWVLTDESKPDFVVEIITVQNDEPMPETYHKSNEQESGYIGTLSFRPGTAFHFFINYPDQTDDDQ